jgi:glutathione S-transferase
MPRMTDTIEFYYNPMSRARIVHWMLEEVGAPYEIKSISFEAREHKSPEFLAINPMGKLPTIVHRGVVITETPAIITYLADAFPAKGLAPALDDPQRGTYLRWMFFAASCVEAAMLDKAFGREVPPEKKGAVGYGSYADTLAAIERAITPGPFVLGERFSAVDLYLGSQVGYGLMFKTIEPNEAFAAYVERGRAREAFQRISKS